MGAQDDSRRYEPQRRPSGAAELGKDAVCVALLAALVVGLLLPVLLEPERLLASGSGEGTFVTWPAFHYLHQRVRGDHEVPLWNPYVCSGAPFLGTSTAPVFSPVNVSLLAEDPRQAYALAAALLVWLAGASMYAFLRGVQIGRHAALAGGAWYMLSGYVLGHLSDPAALAGPAFLPLVVGAFALAFVRRSWAWTGTAALCWALSTLACGLHADGLTLAVLAALALTCSWPGGASIGGRLARLVVGVAVGSALAGVQLLPAFGVLEHAAYPARFAGANHVSFASLTSLVAPGMIRNASGITLSIGALGLVFALLSVRLRSVYWVKFLWGIAIAVLGALVLLRLPALEEVTSRLPRFDEVQQARALSLVVFALAALAAIRLDWTLLKEKPDVERLFGLVVALFLAVAVGGLLLLRDNLLQDKALKDVALAQWIVGERWQAGLIVGAGAVAAALFWIGNAAVRWLVLPLAVIELAVPFVVSMRTHGELPAALTDALPGDASPHLRMMGNKSAFPPNALLARGARDVNGTDVPVPRGYRSYMEYVERGRTGGFERGVRVTRQSHPLLTLAGVQYAYAAGWRSVDRDAEGIDARRVWLGGWHNVDRDAEGIDARRAWLADGAVAVHGDATDDERLARLEEAMAQAPRGVVADHDLRNDAGEGDGSAEIVEDRPERVRVRTTAGSQRVLVLADPWATGWEASVDGREVPRDFHRVNLWMRGVEVPAGTHEVEFSYRPPWVRKGLLASAAGLAGVVLLWLLALRRPVVQPIG